MEPKADPSESSPKRRLQVLPPSDEIVSSMGSDGHRRFVYAASVTGRFATMRRIGFAILFAIFLGLPFIRLGGRPIILLDIAKRQFFLFGLTFNSQDA